MLPEFNQDGALPEGVHRATEVELLDRFATSSARRKWLGEKLQNLLRIADATRHLERVYVWGSFVTAKEAPNDLDILIVLDAAFNLAQAPVECRELFDYAQAKVRFSADVFGRRRPSVKLCCNCGWILIKRVATLRGAGS
jgi:hypothetical protein